LLNASDAPDPNYQLYQEGLAALEKLSLLRPEDIFALEETWTDADTELIRRLDMRSSMWVPFGSLLTTKSFRKKLPSVADFESLVSRSPLAVVGGADSLTNASLGFEIDEHATVARFNQIVGSRLKANETGVKTDLHIINSKIPPLYDSSVPEMDLETRTPWRSYCGRMHRHGEFSASLGKPFLIRPTAVCTLHSYNLSKSWTRGFLFYWFVARLFDRYDMYGFRGDGHYKNDEPIYEWLFQFEHFVLDVIEPNRY